jgi:integrase
MAQRKTFRKVIVTEETLENINPKNKKLVEQFLKHKSTSVSETTLNGYASDFDIFFTWNYLYNDNVFFVDLKKFNLVEFFSYTIEELQWGHSRRNRVRSALSSLSIFVEKFFDEDYPKFRNIVLKTIESAVGSPVREKTVLSDEQVDSLLEHLSKNGRVQQACWVALAVACGARSSELLRFKLEYIDDGEDVFDGIFIETSKRIKTKGRGGGKMIKKYILKDFFMPYYDAWKTERYKIISETGIEDHGYLFIKNNGEIASKGTIRSWLRGMTDFLGVPAYSHLFRHRTTTYLAEKKIPSDLIQFLMGWDSAGMVALYTDLDAKDREWDELDNLKEQP